MTVSSDMDQWLSGQLLKIDAAHLRRKLRTVESPQGPEIRIEGQTVLNFSSNDYLGLANHPLIKGAAQIALDHYGTGAGASRLISGNFEPQAALDAQIARWKGTDAALTFSSGFAAALGTVTALCGKEDVVILDKLVHACVVDGARMSGAAVRVFPHNDRGKLESHLAWARGKADSNGGKILVITESVFSMDGDRAPLAEMIALKEKYGAWLMIDEAHGLGVLGATGAGLAEDLGVQSRVDIQMGTMSKALGSGGGYIAGSQALVDFLLNRARSFIFSTALPPATCAAAMKAIEVVSGNEGKKLRKLLWENISAFTGAFQRGVTAQSAIIPVMIGDESRALQIAQGLFDAGIYVPAIRYPTVAKGAARLRISLSAGHTPQQIARLVCALPAPGQ
ncbi:MAG: 8-amino-7-oxononanoate synthase [Verrucomicrobiota bacterium]|nr:8-amino-7-oxononanoate synthase [Verrucomicrobiota bacterium]